MATRAENEPITFGVHYSRRQPTNYLRPPQKQSASATAALVENEPINFGHCCSCPKTNQLASATAALAENQSIGLVENQPISFGHRYVPSLNPLFFSQVRELKEKPGADVAKLSNNEAKLTAARQRLQESTSKLYKAFGYYDAIGGKLCQPEIEMFKKAEQGFFGAASAAVRKRSIRRHYIYI